MKTKSMASCAKNDKLNFRSWSKVRRYAATFSLAVTIAGNFGSARSSSAVPLDFTLTGVTFNDGATASGFFIFDPSRQIYGAFDILTTGGASAGSNYSSEGVGTNASFLPSPDSFIFDNFSVDDHYLNLFTLGHITGPGVFALESGAAKGPGVFSNGGEFVNDNFSTINYRLITAGFLTVSGPSVPETGGTLLSLAFGIAALAGFRFSFGRRRAGV
jgi:hypothetical protein